MTIIEKMYAGEKLSEKELQYLATGYSRYCDTEPGEYEEIDQIDGESGRWMQAMETIIRVGDDLWCIPWKSGLTECQENEFYLQPYRVERKERVITQVYYEKIAEDEA